MGKVIDFKLFRDKFKFRKRPGRKPPIPHDLTLHVTCDTEGDVEAYYLGPSVFMETEAGKRIALERIFQAIADICDGDPSIALEVRQLIEDMTLDDEDLE